MQYSDVDYAVVNSVTMVTSQGANNWYKIMFLFFICIWSFKSHDITALQCIQCNTLFASYKALPLFRVPSWPLDKQQQTVTNDTYLYSVYNGYCKKKKKKNMEKKIISEVVEGVARPLPMTVKESSARGTLWQYIYIKICKTLHQVAPKYPWFLK